MHNISSYNNYKCNNLINDTTNINYKKYPSQKYRSRRYKTKSKYSNNECCNSHCYNHYNHGVNYSNNNLVSKVCPRCKHNPCICKRRRPGCCKINPLWWLVFLFFI